MNESSRQIEVIGGPHDGDTVMLPWWAPTIKVPYVKFLEGVYWEESTILPDPLGSGTIGTFEYVIRPHPSKRGWGAVYAPPEWPCSKREHRHDRWR